MAASCAEQAGPAGLPAAGIPAAALALLFMSLVGQTAAAAAPATPVAATAAPGSPAPRASVASAAGAATPAPAVGPAPGNPSALFTMPPAPPCHVSVCWTAQSAAASRTHIIMIEPDIVDTTGGISHITADRADESGADIGNSQIMLTGNVHADMAQGQLSAATATIQVVDKRIESITAAGGPAQFLRLGHLAAAGAVAAGGKASPQAALANSTFHGHADSITYDLKTDTVQLNGNSWLTDGCNEFTSQRITYDLMTQTVQAGPEPGTMGRVYGTIRNTRPGTNCAAAAGKS